MLWYLLSTVFSEKNRLFSRQNISHSNGACTITFRNYSTIYSSKKDDIIHLEARRNNNDYFSNPQKAEIAIQSPISSDISSISIIPYKNISGTIRIGIQNGLDCYYMEINKKGSKREIKWGINNQERTYRDIDPDYGHDFASHKAKLYKDIWEENTTLHFTANVKSKYLMIYSNNELIMFISKFTLLEIYTDHVWEDQGLEETDWSWFISCGNIPIVDLNSTANEHHTNGFFKAKITKPNACVPSLKLLSLIKAEKEIYVLRDFKKWPYPPYYFLNNLDLSLPHHLMEMIETDTRYNKKTMECWYTVLPSKESYQQLHIASFIGNISSQYHNPVWGNYDIDY